MCLSPSLADNHFCALFSACLWKCGSFHVNLVKGKEDFYVETTPEFQLSKHLAKAATELP